MRELLLEGRVSWRSERPGQDGTLSIGQDRTLSIGPVRILGLRRIVAALGFAAVAALVAVIVGVVAGSLAAGLGARWTARRREQGLDDPIAVVQRQARAAREWIDARRTPDNEVGGGHI